MEEQISQAGDPSQRAATPLAETAAAVLLQRTRSQKEIGETDGKLSDAAVANMKQAAMELQSIFELRGSTAFAWFERTFIDGPFLEARRAFTSEHTPEADLVKCRERYFALRGLKATMIEREIAHRDLLDPNDSETIALRERLNLL